MGPESSWKQRQAVAPGGLVACISFGVGGSLGYWLARTTGVNGLIGYVSGVVLGYLTSRHVLRRIVVRQAA